MLPEDTFRRAFEAATADLTRFAEAQREAAAVEHEMAPGFWRLAMRPLAVNACPVELLLHRGQTRDLAIASELYEATPVGDLALLRQMLEAIVAGRVVTRTWSSGLTGAAVACETIVTLAGGLVWSPVPAAIADVTGGTLTKRDRHYVGYRRG